MENRPLYSAEITEIIGTPPRWIIRTGGGLLLLVFLGFIALGTVIRLPEHSSSPVRLSGTTKPFYLTQATGPARPVVASGQRVARGQLLLGAGPDTLGRVRAPFAGTLLLAGPAAGALSPGDTLGVLLPLHNTYRFSGRVELGRAGSLARRPTLPIQVALGDRPEGALVLQGRLGYLNPIVRHGQVAYVGQLDSLSNLLLARELAAVTEVDGTLLLRGTRQPMLQSLFH